MSDRHFEALLELLLSKLLTQYHTYTSTDVMA